MVLPFRITHYRAGCFGSMNSNQYLVVHWYSTNSQTTESKVKTKPRHETETQFGLYYVQIILCYKLFFFVLTGTWISNSRHFDGCRQFGPYHFKLDSQHCNCAVINISLQVPRESSQLSCKYTIATAIYSFQIHWHHSCTRQKRLKTGSELPNLVVET